MTRKAKAAALVGALALVGVILWLQFGTVVRTRACCGTHCWAVDADGQALNPDDVYCETATVDSLPE